MGNKENEISNFDQFLFYRSTDGDVKARVLFQDETIWMTQKDMAELYDKSRNTITEHLRHIFEEGELSVDSTCRDFRHVANNGKLYVYKLYSLDAIISVGYRVNSYKATQFRIWATDKLRNFKSGALPLLNSLTKMI